MELVVKRIYQLTETLINISLSENEVWYNISLSYTDKPTMDKDSIYNIVKAWKEGEAIKTTPYYSGPLEVHEPGSPYGTIQIPATLSKH